MPVDEEVIVAFAGTRAQPPPARRVRSTVLVASQTALRSRGLYDAYLAQVDAAHREQLAAVLAGAWLPLDVATAHYTACDRLNLGRDVVLDIGAEAGRILNQTVLKTVFKLSREAGMSPWTAFPHSNRLIGRSWEGSTCGVFKVGPKEARFEWIGQPLAVLPYFRVAFGGFIRGILSLFSRVAHVRELPRCCSTSTLGYRCSWV
jgi:hypothetical protein